MDTSGVVEIEQPKRQRRSIAEKRRIVELAMPPGASVARVARDHGVMPTWCITGGSSIARADWERTRPTAYICCQSA